MIGGGDQKPTSSFNLLILIIFQDTLLLTAAYRRQVAL